jgi:hypothetical protein
MFSLNFNIEAFPERKLIVAKVYGIWKKETAVAYHEEYMKTVQPFLGDKWAKLTNLTNWKSSYPEIIEIIGEHMRWCQDNGAVFSTYVIDNPVTQGQLKRMVSTGKASSITKLFKSYEEADRFLKENGF